MTTPADARRRMTEGYTTGAADADERRTRRREAREAAHAVSANPEADTVAAVKARTAAGLPVSPLTRMYAGFAEQ